MNRVRSMRI